MMQVENTTETGALLGDDALDIEELPRVGVYVTTVAEGNIPIGSVVVQDPYLQYLESLEDEEAS